MANPDPSRITDQMWDLWLGAERVIPGVRLSGIYANKKGYHNTVNANRANWPDNYSIKLNLDLNYGNLDKARAIDLTMSDREMIVWTRRMRDSAMDPHDDRLDPVREFYGTLDGQTVFGLIKDSVKGEWRRSTADSTHLWHGHTSVFTLFVNSASYLLGLVSVWAGETLSEWLGLGEMFPKQGESGEEVRYWQSIYNAVRMPGVDPITVDGDYGPNTTTAFANWARANGASSVYPGDTITAWLAIKFQTAYIKKTAPVPQILDPTQIRDAVNEWLTEHLPAELTIDGSVEGKVRW